MATKQEHKEWLALVDEIAPIKFATKDRKHPLFNQWFNIAKGTRDPDFIVRRTVLKDGTVRLYKPWDKYGAKRIIMAPQWYDFTRFVKDTANLLDVALDSIPKGIVRRSLAPIYIDRIDREGNFTPNNIKFVFQSELDQDRKSQIKVETPFLDSDGVPKLMTIPELERYLKDHADEPLPEGIGPYFIKQRVWDESAGRNGKFVTQSIKYDTIQPVPQTELRRRLRLKFPPKDLYAPVRFRE